LRARGGATTRITDHSGEITDDQNRLVTQVLKLSQFSQNNTVAKMNVGGGWIDPQFYAERAPEREFRAQFILADDLRGALF
jgi:hypothetical protein